MSDDSEADARRPSRARGPGREAVLAALETGMAECHRKVKSGRMTDPDRERARQGWHQSLAKLANAYRLLARDLEIEDMDERLQSLEGLEREREEERGATGLKTTDPPGSVSTMKEFR
jgi:hypothetical protein